MSWIIDRKDDQKYQGDGAKPVTVEQYFALIAGKSVDVNGETWTADDGPFYVPDENLAEHDEAVVEEEAEFAISKADFMRLIRGEMLTFGSMRRAVTLRNGPFIIVDEDAPIRKLNAPTPSEFVRVEPTPPEVEAKISIPDPSLRDRIRVVLKSFVDGVYKLIGRGGEGSGHFEHEGRRGEVGGSLPSGISNKDISGAMINLVGLSETPEQAAWIGDRGNFIGTGADHQESAIKVLDKLDPDQEYSKWDAVVSVVQKGLIRHLGFDYQHGFTVSSFDDLNIEQKDAIVGIMVRIKGKKSNAEFIIDELTPIPELPGKYGFDTVPSKRVVEGLGLNKEFWKTDHPFRVRQYIDRGGEGSGHFEHEGRPGEVGGKKIVERAIWEGEPKLTHRRDEIESVTIEVRGPLRRISITSRSHSRSKCMECDNKPVVATHWANGHGMAWFCFKHFKSWVREDERDIVGVWVLEEGECPEDIRKTPSGTEKIRKLGERISIDKVFSRVKALIKRGGEGSGHFGHEGRPSKVGGSLPGKRQVGLTSARPGKPSREVFIQMRDFQSKLQEIGGVSDVSVKPGLGGWEGGSEPTWVINFRGNGNANSLIAQTALDNDQDGVLLIDPCNPPPDCAPVIDFHFADSVTPSERDVVESMLVAQGVGGWTWYRREGEYSSLRAVYVPDWEERGTDEYYESLDRLRFMLNKAEMPHLFEAMQASVSVMNKEGENSYGDFIGRGTD